MFLSVLTFLILSESLKIYHNIFQLFFPVMLIWLI